MNKRILTTLKLLSLLALIAPFAAIGARAEYPDQSIRLIVPTAPGGAADRSARIVAEKMADELKQPIVVENRSGAGTVIGTSLVLKAPADGYTMLFATISLVLAPALYDANFDPTKDFRPVGWIARQPLVLCVRKGFNAATLQEFVAMAKAGPGNFTFASAGVGTGNHLSIELFMRTAGITLTHVPYQGTGPLMADLLGERVDMVVTPVVTMAPYIASGQVRALAVAEAKRLPELPDVPTFAEQGVAYETSSWNGLVVRAGTPDDVVAKLNTALNHALADEATVHKLVSGGGTIAVSGTPQEFGAVIAKEYDLWKNVIKSAGIKINQ